MPKRPGRFFPASGWSRLRANSLSCSHFSVAARKRRVSHAGHAAGAVRRRQQLLHLSPLFSRGEVEAAALAKASGVCGGGGWVAGGGRGGGGGGGGSAQDRRDGRSGRACCRQAFPTRQVFNLA